jgi:hypothetical protein
MNALDCTTGKVDANGNEIFLGSYLQDMKCKFLTYQVRIREGKFVLHSGGCWKQMRDTSELIIIKSVNSAILGIGNDLFVRSLVA